jgi:probable rRNA maturation factor
LIVIEPPSTGTGVASFSALRKPDLARFLKRAQKAVGLSGEVTVLLADDARLKDLHRTFRRKNKPTDVLSFPAAENGEGVAGDLAVSVETAARQAAEHGHALDDELRILMLHGVLHLAGYDHEVDKGEMRAFESDLRAKLKLPVGLIERTLGTPKKSKAAVKPASLQDVGHPVRRSTKRAAQPEKRVKSVPIEKATKSTSKTAAKKTAKKQATKKTTAKRAAR